MPIIINIYIIICKNRDKINDSNASNIYYLIIVGHKYSNFNYIILISIFNNSNENV